MYHMILKCRRHAQYAVNILVYVRISSAESKIGYMIKDENKMIRSVIYHMILKM